MTTNNNLDALSQGAGSTTPRKAFSLRPWWTRDGSGTTRRTNTAG